LQPSKVFIHLWVTFIVSIAGAVISRGVAVEVFDAVVPWSGIVVVGAGSVVVFVLWSGVVVVGVGSVVLLVLNTFDLRSVCHIWKITNVSKLITNPTFNAPNTSPSKI